MKQAPVGVRDFTLHTAWAMAEGRGVSDVSFSCPQIPVQTPILDGLGDVFGADFLGTLQIGDGAAKLEDFGIGTSHLHGQKPWDAPGTDNTDTFEDAILLLGLLEDQRLAAASCVPSRRAPRNLPPWPMCGLW